MLRFSSPRSPSEAIPDALMKVPSLVLVLKTTLSDEMRAVGVENTTLPLAINSQSGCSSADRRRRTSGRRSRCQARLRSRPRASAAPDRRRYALRKTVWCSTPARLARWLRATLAMLKTLAIRMIGTSRTIALVYLCLTVALGYFCGRCAPASISRALSGPTI